MLDNPVINQPTKKGPSSNATHIREVINDFRLCCISREVSLLARKEVLTGKAKFGITGDGKEVPQVAMAKAFQKGDWRAGYYRDQTLFFALGLASVEEYFAQLYADTENDPWSGGRQMNAHFATPTIDEEGEWVNHREVFNSSADVSCTAGQMARALGLAFASKKYRESEKLHSDTPFSNGGSEVCFCTIGDASTSEGVFWETLNAASVLQVPLVISVWDDGFGISVPTKYQTTKCSISEALEGLRLNEKGQGIDIYKIKAWDYQGLCDLYKKAIEKTRRTHIPVLIHVEECTQPQGHSTSGSHERYKSDKRLQWERDFDCIRMMQKWMIDSGIGSEDELNAIQKRAKEYVRDCKNKAWQKYSLPIKKEFQQLEIIYSRLLATGTKKEKILEVQKELRNLINPVYSQIVQNARRLYFEVANEQNEAVDELKAFLGKARNLAHKRYHTHQYSASKNAALNVPVLPPQYSESSPLKNGFEVLNAFFDKALEKYPAMLVFGEDVGHIGDVNQGFAGMQKKYGKERVFDTGIREWTIMGKAIGLAMRGLRPIAEIQYLDYLVYGLEPLMDDLATLRWRSNNIQQAPAIIRTRGHRLEGIWHTGSPLGMIINSLRGMYVLVPRNMVQAAGMYNTLLQSDDPAIIIECLNGYRLKERLPDNLGEYTVPLGIPDILQEGTDLTLVTYGTCVRIAQEGIRLLKKQGVSIELIDVQTLLPFDTEQRIVESLKKTNRILFMDEDVPGGATGFMMQEVLEKQKGYRYLDSPPQTLTAKAHRPPYGSDGDYFCKPNPEDVFETVFKMLQEAEPVRFK